MNVNFSAWSIRNPIPAVLFFIVICAVGLVAFFTLPITRFPNIDVPVIAVSITQQGAAPSELESQVTRKVEDGLASVSGVKHLQSTINEGQSTTVIEFRLETNTDRAVNDVKDAIAKIRGDLPRTIDEPIVQRIDVEGQSILTYAASSPGMTLEQLSWHIDDVVKREVQGLKGVGRVERYGGVNREIHVELDQDRLLALGVTASDVNAQLRATNADFAGGRGEIGGKEQPIRTLAAAKTLEQLAATKINLPGGRDVRLDEIARVSDSNDDPRSFSRFDAQPVVSFAIFRAKGASDVSVKTVIEAKVAELRKAHPEVELKLIDDAVSYTKGNYDAALETLVEGALLSVLVVLIFLRDWRATLISAVALPLSIIPTFYIMQWLGFSMNLVSMLALTLATGILVDDAIVEIENIVRHMRMGKSAYRASIEAADEIGMAVIAITFTIVAVFVPVSFMDGIAGQYFKQFGMTVAAAVLVSLLVARLITPMLSAYFMRSHHIGKEEKEGAIIRAYAWFLRGTLRFWWVTIAVGVAIFMVSIWGMQFLPTGFIPDEDNSRLVLSVELPPGSTLADTARTTDVMTQKVKAIKEVESVFVLGGASPKGQSEVRNAVVVVNLVHKTKRTIAQKQLTTIVADALAGAADVRYWYVNDRGERGVSVSVLGADPDALAKGVAMLETAIRHEPGFYNVAGDAGLDRTEVRILPKPDQMTELGIAPDAIADLIRVATFGDFSANLAKFNAGDRLIPIRVRLDPMARTDINLLGSIRIRTGAGKMVPLSSVADISFGQSPSTIERYDRVRRVTIGADLVKGIELGSAVQKIMDMPAAKALPDGVTIQQAGDAEIMGEVFSGFAKAAGIGLLMMLCLMILLLQRVFQPVTIVLSLAFSIGGVIVALLITRNSISMPVVIGMLMLMGIVAKNGILLVDFAVERVKHGLTPREAIIDAGRKRARPIIMTTVAMAAGMFPTALGIGDGGEFRAPMAIAVTVGSEFPAVIHALQTLVDDFADAQLHAAMQARIFQSSNLPRPGPK